MTKCVKYWPDSGAIRTFGTLQVTSLSEDQYSEFTIRILMLTQVSGNDVNSDMDMIVSLFLLGYKTKTNNWNKMQQLMSFASSWQLKIL